MTTTSVEQDLLTNWTGHMIRIRLMDGVELRPAMLTQYDEDCLLLRHVETGGRFLVHRRAIAVIEEQT
jgi:hypothetical protein